MLTVQWQAQLTSARAAPLEGLVGADLVAEVVVRVPSVDVTVAELVVEPLGREIALLLGDPLVQPEVRRDDEPGHWPPPWLGGFLF